MVGSRVRVMSVVLSALALTACTQDPLDVADGQPDRPLVVDGTPPARPYAGPLRVAVTDDVESPDPLTFSGAAGRAVECDGAGLYGQAPPEGQDLLVGLLDGHGDPESALSEYVRDNSATFPDHGFRVERAEADRVLYSLDVAGRTKAAVVVVDDRDPGTHPKGWVAESYASCDRSELPPEFDEAAGLEVWSDPRGRRANTTRVHSYRDSDDCGSGRTRTLELGEELFLQDPRGPYLDLVQGPGYDEDVELPTGARDLGWRRNGVALWRAGGAVYAVSADGTQRWPRATGRIGCL